MGRGQTAYDAELGVTRTTNSGPISASEWAAYLGRPEQRARLRALGRSLILDLDDTLISNMIHFVEARDTMAPILQQLDREGRSVEELLAFQEQVSASLVPRWGYTPKRWRKATVRAGIAVAGRRLTQEERQGLLEAAELALSVGEILDGVEDALQVLHDEGVKMVLVTKGDLAKQQEKLAAHQFDRFFGDRIQVVSHKDPELLQTVAAQYGLTDPVVIGDSRASDVAPALAAGFAAVHIDKGEHGRIWLHEQAEVEDEVPVVESFPEAVAAVLDRL